MIYAVVHYSEDCDPAVLNGPHPFAPLVADPEAVYHDSESYIPEFELPEKCARELALPSFDQISSGDCNACEEFADRPSMLLSALQSLLRGELGV